jgi:hypothetical protein
LLTPFEWTVRSAITLATGHVSALPTAYGVGWLFGANALFVVTFEFMACTLVVYAVRALRNYQPHKENVHDWFRRLTIYGLWFALAGGLCESWAGYAFYSQPSALWRAGLFGVTSAVRWLGIGTLLCFLVIRASYPSLWKSRRRRSRNFSRGISVLPSVGR